MKWRAIWPGLLVVAFFVTLPLTGAAAMWTVNRWPILAVIPLLMFFAWAILRVEGKTK